MKRLSSLITLSGLVVLFIGLVSSVASAASYDVSASVPYPLPTQAATINPVLNNVTTQNAAFVISGTCQTMASTTVISVWRGGTTLGSQSCLSGTYSLQITLAEGGNTLIVRTANISAAYGPDSSPITVTLHTPVTPPAPVATPPATTTPTTPGATNLSQGDNTAFNNAARTGLTIVPQEPFSVLPPSKEINFSVYIGGGSNPYTLELNWGDGTTETKVVEKSGNYTFTHKYRNAGNYTIRGKVKDVLGAVTEISYGVVINNPIDAIGGAGAKVAQASLKSTPVQWLQHHWVAVSIGIVGVGVAGTAYLLGQNAAFQTMASGSAAQTQPKLKRKPSKPKPRGKR